MQRRSKQGIVYFVYVNITICSALIRVHISLKITTRRLCNLTCDICFVNNEQKSGEENAIGSVSHWMWMANVWRDEGEQWSVATA